MKKMSVTRLVRMSTAQINHCYRNPGLEERFLGLHPMVVEAGAATDRLLCMSTQVQYGGKELYVTFDEVVLKEGVAYCILRKTARPNSKPAYLESCKLAVGMLGAAFEAGNKRLSTVRRIVEAGYTFNRLNLSNVPRVYVLDYNGKQYDIVADEPMCLRWMVEKLDAANSAATAADFDTYIPPSIYSWDI